MDVFHSYSDKRAQAGVSLGSSSLLPGIPRSNRQRLECSANSLLCVVGLLLSALSADAGAAPPPESNSMRTASAWMSSSARHGLNPLWLYAIALQESRRSWADGRVRPWPWTLYTPDEGSLYFSTYEEALRKLRQLIAAGTTNIDVGIEQISWRHHGYRVSDPAKLLDITTNIDVSAKILREGLDATGGDLKLAIARYHSPKPERGLPYAASVLAILEALNQINGMRDALSRPDTFVAPE